MQTFAKEHDIMSNPRHALIGSYKAQKILLGTPLLKFYQEEGLVVTPRAPNHSVDIVSLASTLCQLCIQLSLRR